METETLPTKEETPVSPLERKNVVDAKGKGLAKEALLVSGSILLGSLIVAGAILTLAPRESAPANPGVAAPVPVAADPEDMSAVVSIDDDAILGDKQKARVAIVEFSDLECPFCKRFHAETFDTLVKEYVDTGKAIIVARDYPLSFHDPKASEGAAFAECVRKEKGDGAYFSFIKGFYANTLTNGKGLPAGKMEELIGKAGARVASVTACAGTDAVKAEVQKDMADGSAVGISGTPSFVIGTLDDKGMVTGERLVGALPIEGFRTKIDQYLTK